MEKKHMLYLKQAAEELGLTEWDLRQRARSGRIPCLKSGNRYIFPSTQCQKWLEDEAMANIKPVQEEDNQYGKLRKINI